MVRAAERSPGGPVPALVTVLLLVLGVLVGTASAATAAPPAAAGGTAAYTGELMPEQLALVLESGVDRREVLTAPGRSSGSVLVEVVLGERTANALIAQGVPLQARSSAARAFAATAGVFRPWSGAGGLRDEFLELARSHPQL